MNTRSRIAGGMRMRPDARMRQRAAQERHLLHARQPYVADILPAAAHVAVVLLAQQPRADALVASTLGTRGNLVASPSS